MIYRNLSRFFAWSSPVLLAALLASGPVHGQCNAAIFPNEADVAAQGGVYAAHAVDLTSDGRKDVIILTIGVDGSSQTRPQIQVAVQGAANPATWATVLPSSGTWPVGSYPQPTHSKGEGLVAGDVDHDGDYDVVTQRIMYNGNPASTVELMVNTGNPSSPAFTSSTTVSGSGGGISNSLQSLLRQHSVELALISNSSYLDLLRCDGTNLQYYANPTGTFSTAVNISTIPSGLGPTCVQARYVQSSSSWIAFVGGANGSIAVMTTSNGSSWTNTATITPSSAYPIVDLTVDDFNGDGVDDVVAVTIHTNYPVLALSTSSSSWTVSTGSMNPINHSALSVGSGDVDYDGKNDVIFGIDGSSTIPPAVFWSNDGSGCFHQVQEVGSAADSLDGRSTEIVDINVHTMTHPNGVRPNDVVLGIFEGYARIHDIVNVTAFACYISSPAAYPSLTVTAPVIGTNNLSFSVSNYSGQATLTLWGSGVPCMDPLYGVVLDLATLSNPPLFSGVSTDSSGYWTSGNISVPGDVGLIGLRFRFQALVNAWNGDSLTNGYEARIGY